MTALERIEVLVCHDNPLWQAGLVATLARHADIECVEGDGLVLDRNFGPMPDIVVADYNRGLELAAAIATTPGREGRPKVLVVTLVDRERDIRVALASGVQGYLQLGCAPEEVTSAIRAVHRGEHVLGPKIASRLAETYALEPLTQREEAVLRLVVEGLCNKSIANRLGITAGTVKSHLSSAFGKLGVVSRTQAMATAQRRGLVGAYGAPSQSAPQAGLPLRHTGHAGGAIRPLRAVAANYG